VLGEEIGVLGVEIGELVGELAGGGGVEGRVRVVFTDVDTSVDVGTSINAE